MNLHPQLIADAAQRIGINAEELNAVVQRGAAVTYQGGDYLFHESAPRQWLGVVMEGEIDLLRGQHGNSVLIGRAQPGAVICEGVMLDETPHGTSGVTRQGATVWQIPRAELENVRAGQPDVEADRGGLGHEADGQQHEDPGCDRLFQLAERCQCKSRRWRDDVGGSKGEPGENQESTAE